MSLPFALLVLAAAQSNLTVQEGLPANLAIDANLSEWTQPPSVVLGAGNQVAGRMKVQSPDDLSARIWLAVSADGLAIAGEVTDEKVRFPQGTDIINADHVELWLAFPPATMPALAFANQFDEIEVKDAAACDQLASEAQKQFGEGDAASCKQWVAQQKRRRASLERLFARQYLIFPQTVKETWATEKVGGEPPESPHKPCCTASNAVVKPFEKGWRFEARIGFEDFPAAAQFPIKDLRVLVDVVDADEGIVKLETFVSSSSKRKFGKPETFNAVTLRQPLVFDSEPPLVATLVTAGDRSVFYFPGKPVGAAFGFHNEPVGYQYTPSAPSPIITRYALGTLEPVATLGEIKVYPVPTVNGPRYWSFRGNKPIDKHNAGDAIEAMVERPPGLHLLISSEGTVSPLGTGACGACPLHSIELVTLDGKGKFQSLLSDDISETGPEEPVEVKVIAEKDLTRFGFEGELQPEAEGAAKPWKKTWRWDDAKKRYVFEKK